MRFMRSVHGIPFQPLSKSTRPSAQIPHGGCRPVLHGLIQFATDMMDVGLMVARRHASHSVSSRHLCSSIHLARDCETVVQYHMPIKFARIRGRAFC